MKVVQYHSVVKNYKIVGNFKTESEFSLDVGVAIKHSDSFSLVGFVVTIDVYGNNQDDDILDYSVETFFVLDLMGNRPTVDELLLLVKSNKKGCLDSISEGHNFNQFLPLNEDRVKEALEIQIESIPANPILN